MEKLLVLSSIIVFLVFAGCSSPENSVKQFSLTEKINLTINDEISMVTDAIMVNNRIYCTSIMEKLFIIFDLEGNIVKNYSASGSGPGEFSTPTTLYHNIDKKAIGILDSANLKTIYFDYDGNHIEDVKIDDFTHFPIRIQMLPTYKLEKYMNINTSGEGPMMTMNDDYVQGEKNISLGSYEFNPLSQNFSSGQQLSSACYPNSFFTYRMQTKDYEFKVYNSDGELSNTIQKEYTKVAQPEEVVQESEERLKTAKNMAKQYGQDISIDPDGYKYKQAINKILLDEQNRIWVLTQDSEQGFFDLYDATGNLIGECPAKAEDFTFSFFNEGKIYSLSVSDDDEIQFKQFEVK